MVLTSPNSISTFWTRCLGASSEAMSVMDNIVVATPSVEDHIAIFHRVVETGANLSG